METKNFRKNLIISADDFGVSPEANAKIIQLAQLGKIDRVAVLVNYSISAEDISALKKAGVKLDLHLDFPKNKPSASAKLSQGAFSRSIFFVINYLLGKNRSYHLTNAWSEQMEKFKDVFEKYPDGLNSHQHIHFFPPYFKIILRLAKNNNVRYIRFGKRALMENANRVPRILETLRKKEKELFLATDLESSDFLASLDWIADFEKFIHNLPDGKTELVCHPERKDEFNLLLKHF